MKAVIKYVATLATTFFLVYLGILLGEDKAVRQVHKDCQEFGGVKLYSGAVIACQVEVLKP